MHQFADTLLSKRTEIMSPRSRNLTVCRTLIQEQARRHDAREQVCKARAGVRGKRKSTFARRGGGLGSSTISKNLMSPTPRRKWYLTTGRRAH